MNEKDLRVANGKAYGGGSLVVKEEKMELENANGSAGAAADYDEPLDFSSRRDEDSVDTADSVERKISRDSGISVGCLGNGIGVGANMTRRQDCCSPAEERLPPRRHSSRSQSPCSASGDSDRAAGSGGLSGESYCGPPLAAIPGAMFSGFPAFFAHGLHPGLASPGPGFWPMAAAMNPLATAALIQDQRKLMSAAAAAAAAAAAGGSKNLASNGAVGGSSGRPFKQYSKDPITMPLGYYAMPGLMHMHGAADNAAMAQIIKSQSEELLSMYRQQMCGDTAGSGTPDRHRRLSKDTLVPSSAAVSSSGATVVTVTASTVRPGVPATTCVISATTATAAVAATSSATASAVAETRAGTAAEPRGDKASKGVPVVSGAPPLQALGCDVASTASSVIVASSVVGPAIANMSSASSTHSSMSSDGEGFGASPSSIVAAATPTSTTGRSSSHQSSRKRAMRTLPTEQKDDAYWERRRKNNEAAKRSRDARRAKEDEIAIRAAFLEQENLRLRVDLAAVRQEVEKLRAALVAQQAPKNPDTSS